MPTHTNFHFHLLKFPCHLLHPKMLFGAEMQWQGWFPGNQALPWPGGTPQASTEVGNWLPLHKVSFISAVTTSYLVVKVQVPILEPGAALPAHFLHQASRKWNRYRSASIYMVISWAWEDTLNTNKQKPCLSKILRWLQPSGKRKHHQRLSVMAQARNLSISRRGEDIVFQAS